MYIFQASLLRLRIISKIWLLFPFRYTGFFNSKFCYNRLKYIQKLDSLSKMSPPLTNMKFFFKKAHNLVFHHMDASVFKPQIALSHPCPCPPPALLRVFRRSLFSYFKIWVMFISPLKFKYWATEYLWSLTDQEI